MFDSVTLLKFAKIEATEVCTREMTKSDKSGMKQIHQLNDFVRQRYNF
jgi:hypothetical protein